MICLCFCELRFLSLSSFCLFLGGGGEGREDMALFCTTKVHLRASGAYKSLRILGRELKEKDLIVR